MPAHDPNDVMLTLKVSIAWWLKPYFYALATISALTGLEPNYERVNHRINKAVKVRAV